jgi:hypothetical protein
VLLATSIAGICKGWLAAAVGRVMTVGGASVAGAALGFVWAFRGASSAIFGSLANFLWCAFAGAEPNVKVEFVFGGSSVNAAGSDGGILPDQHARAAETAERRLIGGKLFEIDDIRFRNFEAAAHIERRIDEPVALFRATIHQADKRESSIGIETGTPLLQICW